MQNGSTARRRRLGKLLRSYREAARMSVDEAAPKLDWSKSKLSRIENAEQGVDVHWVRSMLDLYGVGGERWEEIIALTREAREPGWWRAYGMRTEGYVPLEADATAISDYAVSFVPGLLQTDGYIRAIFAASVPARSAERLEKAVTVRMIRKQRLTSESRPLTFTAVIEEAALRRPIGGAEVMREQLGYLVEAAELPTVTLQVLPTAVGAHAALSAFSLLTFGDIGEPDMAYAEHLLGATHSEKVEEVLAVRLAFDQVRGLALSPIASLVLIQSLLDGVPPM